MFSGRLGELLLILLIVLIFFGAGKLPKVMQDLGRGMKAFRKGMDSDPDDGENVGSKIKYKSAQHQRKKK